MEILEKILNWLSENYGLFISLLVQSFIAYHIFFLSKRLSDKAKLEHKERIKKKAEELKLGREVYLVNVKRYFKDYPSNKEKMFSGYSHIKAEIKTTRFDGVEFICGIKEIYRKPDGCLTLNTESKKTAQEKIKVFEVGVIPYEWIEYIDLRGDEHGFVPLFFGYFKGRRYWQKSWKRFLPFGYPYKEIIYYKESGVYHEGSDPVDMKFSFIDEPISNE
ncbi:MAG: hypothetical protein UR25_C0001G0161 [Candidatus Nomurabacteria bacterium GW2011_GWE1_32_28]|uniref:Uncharacterized protein n=1 Tax=Candidatus Nomurabacteria bacterium GW2011_GWF1_31_48 TaxID=1618767 RepID=A0A0G0BHV4_9BACT|nr:MAG: hypothetical protein UR10_C0002G0118 [Candidatus Nomurabacteria bacterium GW2011_GWF2_30_133]KKP28993.1 MAG: hypothetical protein UR18_C0001G0114 [Candidatus Nomurabacteria bacterium GW2011_GWE2_31_40]KKP30597.1 MAG: hypothetical protein UR19_C0002G0118 [Candidatus Nomurabacteria bacterium GW2011_GWF1_31_48]KKP35248.1 MAG: hypothetical protein UR25_C0001G0161 [Candidatus Nomurabacteria bacterium GW2011_GWE1_32_28]HAS80555.1 hypothetical protein [Candidatus Nomurabacteria bacterium]